MKLRSDEGGWICSRMEGAMLHKNVEIRSISFDLISPKNQKHDEQKFIDRKSCKKAMETKQEQV